MKTPDTDDRPLAALDDEVDRDELRRRNYGLPQELRVLLPGVQILVAFLLTAPFAARVAARPAATRGVTGDHADRPMVPSRFRVAG